MENIFDINAIIQENNRRKQLLITRYDPIRGIGCVGKRVKVAPTTYNDGEAWIPQTMYDALRFCHVNNHEDWVKLRCLHDFEYWAATCATIKDKVSGEDIKFVLNSPQRRMIAILEEDRLALRPLRYIVLKARQWGASMLVQAYLAWMQTVRHRNWNSVICAHVKDSAANIRGMYSKMLNNYPEQYWDGDEPPKFRAFERSENTREIAGRECRVTIASSENVEAVRGADFSMAQLSEVAFWKDSKQRRPEDFIRAICGGIARVPDSVIIMESTANGVGNFFHREWVRAKAGKSDKTPIMIPWYEIEIYRSQVDEPLELWNSLDEYERNLWHKGLTLEMIKWYHDKRKEYSDHAMMKAEFPTDDIEAFANTGSNVFDIEKVEILRRSCRPPTVTGELVGLAPSGAEALKGLHFVESAKGKFAIWQMPCRKDEVKIEDRYIVTVDVGGRSSSSDYSVIAVLDRMPMLDGRGPEIVAQWRGHCDHDILAWRSAAIASWYNNALLVIESNSIETQNYAGDSSKFMLSELHNVYTRLYRRTVSDRQGGGIETRIGFHTNVSTKFMVINKLVQLVREAAYIERSDDACNELISYQRLENGTFGAASGYNDDILMTRAIGLFVAFEIPLNPILDYSRIIPHNSW